MKLPVWLSGRPRGQTPAQLVGCWLRVRAEVSSQDEEAVEIQITDDGRLRYCVLTDNKWQIMKLICRTEGDTLITDQPSAPREERTRFAFEDDGSLMLEYEGKKAWYRRGKCRAPAV